MGCDIHIYSERKNKDGKWLCTDFFEANHYYEVGSDDEWEKPMSHFSFYKGRDYELFGALAGVRANHIEHIEPKGFPDDASKECLEDFTRWDTDAHTPSYLTLLELKQHHALLGNTIKRSGMISESQKNDLDNGITPDSWCGWTSLDGYVLAEWEDEYNPLDNFLDQLNTFIKFKYHDYEIKSMEDSDFRIVFWFDN